MKLGADGKKWRRQQLSPGKTKAWVLTQQSYFMNLEGSGPKCFTRICCCLPSWTIQGTPDQLKFLGMQAVGWKMFSPPSLKGRYVSQGLQKGRTGTQLCLGVVCSSRTHWAWPVMRFFFLINSLDPCQLVLSSKAVKIMTFSCWDLFWLHQALFFVLIKSFSSLYL